MGGMGAWDIGAAHPERFAAVVPICGRGEPEPPRRLKGCPSGPSAATPTATRPCSTSASHGRDAPQARANAAKLTEYRGVGHNSWDRAYNDPELIEWMLAQVKMALMSG